MRLSGGLVRAARPFGALLVAVALGCGLALAPALAGWGGVARACGINTQIMVANNIPAVFDPTSINLNLPEPGGIFTLDYVAGKPITFTEDLSRIAGAPSPDTFKWRWSFGDHTGYVSGFKPTHTFAKAGTYSVQIDYYDATTSTWQLFDYARIRVAASVPANPPTAHITASATSVALGTDVTFEASGSKSGDGSALTYTWDFNDGTRQSGPRVTYKYVIPEKTIVQLLVTDGRGAKAVDTLNIVAVSDLPVAGLLASATSVAPGAQVTFDASQSRPPNTLPNDRIEKYVWDFGDGTPQQTTPDPTTTHSFASAGKYTVTVQAYDLQDAAGTATVTIMVGNQSATSVPGGSGRAGGFNWPLLVILLVLAAGGAVGGFFWLRSDQQRRVLERQRRLAMEFARARRVTQVRRQPGTPPGSPRPPETGG